ncbi:MAG: Ig-like domain-containing protein, partial [Chlorobi bacterium]|nr:Ig-like domain-containing protein [Chlorobiota bacterium]
MNKSRIYIILTILLLLVSCAQVGSLTGGEKDITPPVLLSSTPENFDTNFKNNKLIFKFDEYFVLNNLNSVFICSPPLKEKPEFKIKGKKFIVKFNEDLKDSTTYMLWFA